MQVFATETRASLRPARETLVGALRRTSTNEKENQSTEYDKHFRKPPPRKPDGSENR